MDIQQQTEPGQDFGEHRRTYDLFVKICVMGALHVVGVLLVIVIATIESAPVTAVVGFVLITAAAIYGLLRPGTGDARPAAAVLVLLFIVMAVMA